MTHGVKVRLIAFLVLSAVGVVYVAASYLGLVDKALGRGVELHATLPTSGGLFVGSEVTYRGVKVGKVSGMDVIPSGVRVDVALEEGTKIPRNSPVRVHNLSAVGEQYLDFVPTSNTGPYAVAGDTIKGDAESMPQSTDDLLIKLDGLVSSVNRNDLSTVVSELGTMFRGTADPLRRLVDAGSTFVDAARASQSETISLLDDGQTVLGTQQANADNIRGFARDLADLTGSLKGSDADLRTILQGGAPAANEVRSLLKGLQPTLPVFVSNLVTVNQVMTARLPAIEQLLVTFPKVISSGFTGTPGDGYGHINLQLNYDVPACGRGYKPEKDWLPASDTRDVPTYPAKCTDKRADPNYTGKTPILQRGVQFVPEVGAVGGDGYRVAPYDAKTGRVDDNLTVGRRTVFGDNSWQGMLLGSTGY